VHKHLENPDYPDVDDRDPALLARRMAEYYEIDFWLRWVRIELPRRRFVLPDEETQTLFIVRALRASAWYGITYGNLVPDSVIESMLIVLFWEYHDRTRKAGLRSQEPRHNGSTTNAHPLKGAPA